MRGHVDTECNYARQTCADSGRFVMGGVNSFQLFQNVFLLLMREERIENTTNSGPLSASQQNAISMAFRWRANDGATLNASLVVS